ncbi:hypothetical protein KIPB_000032 [Kipferlia bialata]|uniref:Uncharacterized protein n=1 Tax=Kipferlia bialata TaxID=797122 RepID=A0A9K3CLY0_9EUKA|nr:hypothetical protein KIPB_000032 [Kipferlia bialata]|eukprot:g32.t1
MILTSATHFSDSYFRHLHTLASRIQDDVQADAALQELGAILEDDMEDLSDTVFPADVPCQLEILYALRHYLGREHSCSMGDGQIESLQACVDYLGLHGDEEENGCSILMRNLTCLEVVMKAIEELNLTGPGMNVQSTGNATAIQPGPILRSLTVCVLLPSAWRVLTHPIYKYVLDPDRNYDMTEYGYLLAWLLVGGIYYSEDASTFLPVTLAVHQGLFASVLVPYFPFGSENTELFFDACECLRSRLLVEDGYLRPEAKQWFPYLFGSVSMGVPECVVNTLSLCATECARQCSNMTEQDGWCTDSIRRASLKARQGVMTPIRSFLTLHETGAFELTTPVSVQRLVIPSVFSNGCRALQIGLNRAILVSRAETRRESGFSATTVRVSEPEPLASLKIGRVMGPDAEWLTTTYYGSNPICINGQVYVWNSSIGISVLSLDTGVWENMQVYSRLNRVTLARLSDSLLIILPAPERLEPDTDTDGEGSETVDMEEESPGEADMGVVVPWIYDTDTQELRKGTESPAVFHMNADWDIQCETIGSVMLLSASDRDHPSKICLSYAISALHQEGQWTQVSGRDSATIKGIHMRGIGGGLLLSFDRHGHVFGYDTVSNLASSVLFTLPEIDGLMERYTSCRLSEDSMLLIGQKDTRIPYIHKGYVLYIDSDCLRDRCESDSRKRGVQRVLR